MSAYFCLAFRFLDRAFHGRGDSNHREWPPSPLRAFQSLVAAAARQHAGALEASALAALKWLERQQPPAIVSPVGIEGSGYCLSVPNNAMDIVAKAWCRGDDSNSGDANPATHRTMKAVRPTVLLGEAAQYLWPLGDPPSGDIRRHADVLSRIARSAVALGWGLDMVVGHGAILTDEQVANLIGERWLPVADSRDGGLRVPLDGTLDDLVYRHKRFVERLGPDGFVPPPPLSIFRNVQYRRAGDPPRHPVAVFSLLKLDTSGFRAFDTVHQALRVAGMVRCAAKLAAKHSGGTWTEEKINAFILGHGHSSDAARHVAVGAQRFAYLPLPTIEGRGEDKARVVGSVRRIMLYCFAEGCENEITWSQRMLSGQELIDEDKKQSVALLSVIPSNEKIVRCYTQAAATWATVTPVLLPGYDDPNHYRRRLKHAASSDEQKRLLESLDTRIDALLRKAITQAGYSQELADHAELDWRKVGFWPGTDLADRHGVPNHLKRFPRFHVKVCWRDAKNQPIEIPGPVCFGGGRFYGLGLFAAL
jgi:CRISPR-associated protein Csb2